MTNTETKKKPLRYNGPVAYGLLYEKSEMEMQDGYAGPDTFIYRSRDGEFEIIKVEKVGIFEDESTARRGTYPVLMIRDRYGNAQALEVDKTLFVHKSNAYADIKDWNFQQTRPKSKLVEEMPTDYINAFYQAMSAAGVLNRNEAIVEAMSLYSIKYTGKEIER